MGITILLFQHKEVNIFLKKLYSNETFFVCHLTITNMIREILYISEIKIHVNGDLMNGTDQTVAA